MNYYNDNDQFAVKWLQSLSDNRIIPAGFVDNRSILDVSSVDLVGFTHVHFFAGIGGWAEALRLAGWPSDVPVWTGSCPCQPFSIAGKGKGKKDERHLWPEFRRLISEFKPTIIFGEQVASPLGREWLAGVCADLEEMGYEVGAADLCAAGVGSPNIRQRLFWGARLADALSTGRAEGWTESGHGPASGRCIDGRMANTEMPEQRSLSEKHTWRRTSEIRGSSRTSNFWSDFVLIPCADGKWRRVPGRWVENTERTDRRGQVECQKTIGQETERPTGRPCRSGNGDQWAWEIEPAIFPLADGLPNRVGALRGAGNAINPYIAAEFIMSFIEAISLKDIDPFKDIV